MKLCGNREAMQKHADSKADSLSYSKFTLQKIPLAPCSSRWSSETMVSSDAVNGKIILFCAMDGFKGMGGMEVSCL